MPRKVYGRVLNEKMINTTDKSVGDKQVISRKGGEVWV